MFYHVHALTFATWYRGSCLKMRLLNQIFKHLLRNPASVNVNKSIAEMISLGCNAFHITTCKQIGVHFKYCQVKTHVLGIYARI